MGLVDYSDSESETETVQQKPTPAAAAAAAAPKKTFQKLLDRSAGAGKIVVNLAAAGTAAETSVEDEQRPAKRAKTVGGSRFSGLGSFLPPPKKTAPAPAASGRRLGGAPAPGVHLRTGAEPAFARGGGDDDDNDASSGLNLPAPHSSRGPSIPEGQKPEEEVKFVGKPLMFKPLSVARKKAPAKNKKKDSGPIAGRPAPAQNGPTATIPAAAQSTEPPPQKKKISLFSMGDDEPTPTTTTTTAPTGTYEPMFTSGPDPTPPEEEESDVTSAYPTYYPTHHAPQEEHQQTFASLTDSLSPAARRELFGRTDPNSNLIPANAKVINFNMEREYEHNEALRASGAQQAYNPVRSIAPGKHSLRQVVNMAQSNQDALEESFARAKNSQKDAAGRYGW
jgi:hypothetical protein